MNPASRLRRRALLLTMLAGAAECVRAEAPLRLLVAYAAGGPADLVARQLMSVLQPGLPRPVRVENLPGAGGALGVQRLLAGPADGSQLLVGTPSEAIVAPLLNTALQYRPRQLRLLGLASRVPMALVGGVHLPQAGLASLLAAHRSQGAQGLNYGSFGVGSLAHLAGHDFAERTGLQMLHVPFGGAAPLQRELQAGRVDLAFLPLGAGLAEQLAAGRLRLYGLAAAQRDPRYPATPTVDEGAGIQGSRHSIWTGLFLPGQAGDAAAEAAKELLDRVLRDPAYRQLKLSEGVEPGTPLSLLEAQRFYEEEIARYQGIVAGVSLRLD
ncbi:MAG TPA: tripartite tricarboxylate transporter substrate binding protein [Roseateles sp.]|nr:tripartite tricarboxylate transporter substrate binding protein [Roseateles sp.]